jgi:hypothetical protein
MSKQITLDVLKKAIERKTVVETLHAEQMAEERDIDIATVLYKVSRDKDIIRTLNTIDKNNGSQIINVRMMLRGNEIYASFAENINSKIDGEIVIRTVAPWDKNFLAEKRNHTAMFAFGLII